MPGGNNPILTNARPPGENAAANARPWGQVSVTNAPHCPGGGWSQLELTDALWPLKDKPLKISLHVFRIPFFEESFLSN